MVEEGVMLIDLLPLLTESGDDCRLCGRGFLDLDGEVDSSIPVEDTVLE
jgi:hypothetical protein